MVKCFRIKKHFNFLLQPVRFLFVSLKKCNMMKIHILALIFTAVIIIISKSNICFFLPHKWSAPRYSNCLSWSLRDCFEPWVHSVLECWVHGTHLNQCTHSPTFCKSSRSSCLKSDLDCHCVLSVYFPDNSGHLSSEVESLAAQVEKQLEIHYALRAY